MKPLLTVVIPVYNVEKYLKRCVESVLVQEWHNYDILLVDDGSTDSSSQICDDYVKAYDFISVIHKENGGLSEARNTGISHAKGDYVYFPDSDDWLEPQTFKELAEVLESREFDIISFNREFVKGEEDVIVSDSVVTQVFEGKDAFVKCSSIVISQVLPTTKYIKSLYLLIIIFLFRKENIMKTWERITSSSSQLRMSLLPIKSIITI